jgi:hypothetical protein
VIPTPAPSWTHDPRERARFLDGEGDAAERAAREADLARDPAARARVDADAAFLRVVRLARDDRPEPSEAFEGRLRRALAADRAAGFPSPVRRVPARVVRRAMLAAATVVLALGAWLAWPGGTKAIEAAPRDDVHLAASAYRSAASGHGSASGAAGTCDEGRASPRAFPPVRMGQLALASCAPDTAGEQVRSVAVLRIPAEEAGKPADPRGLVVVPWDGKSTSTDVGWTRVGDVVVFDVTLGGARYYLATRWSAVAGTASCAACHGPMRADNPTRNPHTFVERTPAK